MMTHQLVLFIVGASMLFRVAHLTASEVLVGSVSEREEGPAGRLAVYAYRFENGERGLMYATPELPELRPFRLLVDRLGEYFLVGGLHKQGAWTPDIKSLNQHNPSVAPVLSQYTSTDLTRLSLSPNAKLLLAFNVVKREIVLLSQNSVKTYPTSWIICSPFSWSPDSSQAAFYYSRPPAEDDVQEHGVAIVAIDRGVQSLCEPQEETATPYSGAKDIPIGWNSSGTFIYISQGRLPADAPTNIDYRRRFKRKIVTVRIEVASKVREEIADGEFADVASDESYILVQRISGRFGGDMFTGCFMRDLNSGAERSLGEGLQYPKISPSGRRCACLKMGKSIVCLNTTSWQPVGIPVSVGQRLIPVDEWASQFRWIILDKATSQGAE